MKKIHPAWLVMIGLGMLTAGSVGGYTILMGSFLTPLSTSLHVQVSQVSYYFSCTIVALAFSLIWIHKILDKVKIKLILTISSLIQTLCGLLILHSHSLMTVLLSATAIGISMGFTCMVPMGIIIKNWFKKSENLALGLSWGINSIFIGIMSPTLSRLIDSSGWHNAMLFMIIVCAIFMLIPSIFLIEYRPEDIGASPYGDKINNYHEKPIDNQYSFFSIIQNKTFIFVSLIMVCIQFTSALNQLFPTYAVVTKFSVTTGGLMVSSAMIFDLFLNIIVGFTCDKFGTIKALLVWSMIAIISFIGLIFATIFHSSYLAIFSAGLEDIMYVFLGTGITALSATVFTPEKFNQSFSYLSIVGYLAGAFAMPILSKIYEVAGSFEYTYVFCLVLVIIMAIFLIILGKSDSLKFIKQK